MKLKLTLLLTLLILSASNAFATWYIVFPGYNGTASKVYHREICFDRSQVYTSLTALFNSGVLRDGDRIYFTGGTFAENITINLSDLEFWGNNAFTESRNGDRTRSESVITGRWTLTGNAHNTTINGFKFTGNGQVYCDAATSANPLRGITFVYNKVEASTLAKNSYQNGVLRLGSYYTGTSAHSGALRYQNVKVKNNEFIGDGNHMADYVTTNGVFGDSSFDDNTFYDGGTPFSIYNSQGNIDIRNNRFTKIGNYSRMVDDSNYNGEFCMRLFYNATSNSTVFNIQYNEFYECSGQGSLYPLIRFFQGDSNSPVYVAQNCKVNLNYNTVVRMHKQPQSGTDFVYNYFFYANGNDNGCQNVIVDHRFNKFDNSEYCIGMVKIPGRDAYERYFASLTEIVDWAKERGNEFTKFQSNNLTYSKVQLARSTTNARSFDVDEETGEVYFCQQLAKNKTIKLGSKPYTVQTDNFVVITRCYKNDSGDMAFNYMGLENAGNGGNMTVGRRGGKLYVMLGSTNAVYVFQFKAGTYGNLATGVFTKDDSTISGHPCYAFTHTTMGGNELYPAIDPIARLFMVVENTSSYKYASVYDLNETLDHLFNGAARPDPIRVVPIEKQGSYRYGNTDNNNIASLDNGFGTWSSRGFEIAGDYIYFLEGDSPDEAAGQGANFFEGNANETNIPIIMVHAKNWRTGKDIYRKPMLRDEVRRYSTKDESVLRYNNEYCKPGGLKVHRDDKGRTHLLFNINSKIKNSSNSWEVVSNIFDSNLNTVEGMTYFLADGYEPNDAFPCTYQGNNYPEKEKPSLDLANPTAHSRLDFVSHNNESQTFTVGLTNTRLMAHPEIEISGWHKEYFSASFGYPTRDYAPERRRSPMSRSNSGNYFDTLSDAMTMPDKIYVTFNPGDSPDVLHNATLRISSPGVSDIVIPMSADNQIPTGVADVACDAADVQIYAVGGQIIWPEGATDCEVYSISGQRHNPDYLTPGIYIARALVGGQPVVSKIRIAR